MTKLTTDKHREIIDDFARQIEKCKTSDKIPAMFSIHFRDEYLKKERQVFTVPIELLRYRKDNGRIGADVISYEKKNGLLEERTKEAQDVIRNMLSGSDIGNLFTEPRGICYLFASNGAAGNCFFRCNLPILLFLLIACRWACQRLSNFR